MDAYLQMNQSSRTRIEQNSLALTNKNTSTRILVFLSCQDSHAWSNRTHSFSRWRTRLRTSWLTAITHTYGWVPRTRARKQDWLRWRGSYLSLNASTSNCLSSANFFWSIIYLYVFFLTTLIFAHVRFTNLFKYCALKLLEFILTTDAISFAVPFCTLCISKQSSTLGCTLSLSFLSVLSSNRNSRLFNCFCVKDNGSCEFFFMR